MAAFEASALTPSPRVAAMTPHLLPIRSSREGRLCYRTQVRILRKAASKREGSEALCGRNPAVLGDYSVAAHAA